ncbi:hypothetical protein L3X38_009423 [Prunus dulcis]|uniref:Uncharacterized protein n=1 Tax=Prunus dulcis TaxID=3755 RepID=A0AAD4WEI9_PRUDU|nr:hypothetical protein L3X38_009423 [Prunus dulcis]
MQASGRLQHVTKGKPQTNHSKDQRVLVHAGTPKLSELEARAIPGWVTTLGSCSSLGSPLRHSDLGEAFWELTGFGFVGTPKLSELEAGAIPGWVTTLGSCFVSSQKQNSAGW